MARRSASTGSGSTGSASAGQASLSPASPGSGGTGPAGSGPGRCESAGGGWHRWAHRIAGLPSGRRTKWAVLVFWVIVVALTGSLAGKLMGAEKNDASAYLPASAESTQALHLEDRFVGKNLNPAVVVYVRPG